MSTILGLNDQRGMLQAQVLASCPVSAPVCLKCNGRFGSTEVVSKSEILKITFI